MSKCLYPTRFRQTQGYTNCGLCLNCLNNKRNAWITRLQLEYHLTKKGGFLGLSYTDDNLPDLATVKPLGSVRMDHVRSFLKRLTSAFEYKFGRRPNLIHYTVSEYAPDTLRPHYHIMFIGEHSYDIHTLAIKAWKYGYVDMDDLNKSSKHKSNKSIYSRAKYVADHSFKSDEYLDKLDPNAELPSHIKSRGIGFKYADTFVKPFVKKGTFPINALSSKEKYIALNDERLSHLIPVEWNGVFRVCSETSNISFDQYGRENNTALFSSRFSASTHTINKYFMRKIARLVDPDSLATIEWIIENEPMPLEYTDMLQCEISDSFVRKDNFLINDQSIEIDLAEKKLNKYTRKRQRSLADKRFNRQSS